MIWGWQPACPIVCHMREWVLGVGDSGLDQRPGGPDVKFLSNNKAFKRFARIIPALKVSNYTLKKY